MILRTLLLLSTSSFISAEYCGNNKVPYGLEVHKNGRLTLLCSRPSCHEKKYADCPERAFEKTCESNTTWVGGLQRTVQGDLQLMCCEYPLLQNYGQLLYTNVLVRRGEYFESEEKTATDDDEVVSFDLISNIKRGKDEKGEFYMLTIHRYHCGKIPDEAPAWYKTNQWPRWSQSSN